MATMAGLSTLQSGPKGTKMINLRVFDHLGPFWTLMDHLRQDWFFAQIELLERLRYFPSVTNLIDNIEVQFDNFTTLAENFLYPMMWEQL